MKTILLTLTLFLSSCYGTYYISDAEYSDLREEHASITYYEHCGSTDTTAGTIYWGWHRGYYYYYGKPHYYPWYYYYDVCPPSHYAYKKHIIINKPVNKPTYRPKINSNKVIIKSNNGSKRTNKRTNKTTIRRKAKK